MRKDSNGTIWQAAYFRQVTINAIFWSNGNKWRKASTRTARMVDSAYTPRAFYFAQNEVCEKEYPGA